MYDQACELIEMPGRTFLIGGETQSTDGIGEGNHLAGIEDIVVAKVSANGRVIWRTIVGGTGRETFAQMKVTPDQGVVVVGTTTSPDGDINKKHRGFEILVIKLDAMGKKEWVKTYGGNGNDKGYCIWPNPDGTYLVGGESGSLDGDMTYSRGGLDAWFAKLDEKGEVVWTKSFGGPENEQVKDIIQLPNRQILVCATSTSESHDIKDPKGKKDAWVFMMSRNLDFIWNKNYGGSDYEELAAVIPNRQGNFVGVGTSFSGNGDLARQYGRGDIWAFEFNQWGQLLWSRNYGGSKSDGANNIRQTPDGGYLISGTTTSEDGIAAKNRGHYDAILIKIDSTGKKEWAMTAGGEDYEAFYNAIALPTGDFLAAGYAESVDGDLRNTGKDMGNDMWFTKISFTEGQPYESMNYMAGRVLDKTNGFPIKAEITLTNNHNLDEIDKIYANETDGLYLLELPSGSQKVSVNFIAPGYMFYGQDVDLDLLTKSPEIHLDVQLEPIRVGSKAICNNLHFVTGEWDLQHAESGPGLARLLYFLKLNPNVKFEIAGFTDNTGNISHKKELSQRRAESVRDYLLLQGISGRRMSVMGYGMEQPVAENDTEEGRAANRRVEIRITGFE